MAPSGFKEELLRTAKSSSRISILIHSSGCLQDWRDIHFSINQNYLPMVRDHILYLPILLQGPGLLQRSMPVRRETEKSL